MGFILFLAFLITLPDGKLRITFCDVGQGDSAYVHFPDGHDMLIDGGPDSRVLSCLGHMMPFWDRHIDLVLLTHAEKDHFEGLTEVVKRYQVGYLIRSDSQNVGPEYQWLVAAIFSRHVPVKTVFAGDQITVGGVVLSFLWPTRQYLAQSPSQEGSQNEHGLVVHLRYGVFDTLFSADADSQVEQQYIDAAGFPDAIEVLKVPHHGSATGMTQGFISWVHPKLAVISVGKNNPYHHPSPQALSLLKSIGSLIFRTDQQGEIQTVSDGKNWKYFCQRPCVNKFP